MPDQVYVIQYWTIGLPDACVLNPRRTLEGALEEISAWEREQSGDEYNPQFSVSELEQIEADEGPWWSAYSESTETTYQVFLCPIGS